MLNYFKEHWKIKDCEKIEPYLIKAYIDYKIEYYPSKQYLQKIISAINKLETALNKYSNNTHTAPKKYDFSFSNNLLKNATLLNLTASNYHNRSYKNPHTIIAQLTINEHIIASLIELEGGARVEACTLIKKEQLHGYKFDEISKTDKGQIWTKEKGGKEGYVYINITTYNELQNHIEENGIFKINRQKYFQDIRNICNDIGIPSEGTHGFRWNFAENRMREYAKAGFTYEQSLQAVSYEMKHNRASITTHYL